MIRPRAHLHDLERVPHTHETRKDSLRLDLNELVPELDRDLFQTLVGQIEPWMFTAYPEVGPAYLAVAAAHGLTEDHVVLGNGSDMCIRHTIEAFCDPGDQIVITYPTYAMYPVYAAMFNLECVSVRYKADFSISADEIIAAIGPRTKIVAIAQPNGILGSVMAVADLERIIRAASAHGSLVILDEAYVHFSQDLWTTRLAEFDNLVLIRTLSKAAGLAGIRFGYILTNPTVRSWIFKMKPNTEINSIAALVGSHLLSRPDILERAVGEHLAGKAFLVAALRRFGFEVLDTQTNFIQVRFGEHKEALLSEFHARNIRVKDQTGSYLMDAYTRVTIGPVAAMTRVIDAVAAVFEQVPA